MGSLCKRRGRWLAALVPGWVMLPMTAPAAPTPAASATTESAQNEGPYNATFLEGGIGLERALAPTAAAAGAGTAWSLTGWIRCVRRQPGEIAVATVGRDAGAAGDWRGLLLRDGRLGLRLSADAALHSRTALEPGRWYAVGATYDGRVGRLYVDGREVASAAAATGSVEARIELAPLDPHDADKPAPHFGGSLAEFQFTAGARGAPQIRALAGNPPDFALLTFTAVGSGWPWQEHAWRGLQEPQDPWTLPHGNSAPSSPRALPLPPDLPDIRSAGPDRYLLTRWRLQAAPQVQAAAEELSTIRFTESDWLPAVVPGTVLTTLIARGIYPDPDVGLNNLSIPDSLSRQDYWYRSVFAAPAGLRGRVATLTFKGINYSAEVWLNGQRLGTIRGAFARGRFDVTGILRPGERNALAVRVSPPPHPGIAHEQSMVAGPGNNGGAMAIDGPTFIAAEGWDWIPGIRDRNTGLWQDVELKGSGELQLRDAQVITQLPLPRTDTADLTLIVPVENSSTAPVAGRVTARIDGRIVDKAAVFPPGHSDVRMDAAEFPQLRLAAPRLWWPNGYGAANLYTLELSVEETGRVSDATSIRFGIRELSYELSLFDHAGRLRRVEVDPTAGTLRGERLVDVRHAAIKRTAHGWAASLTPAGEASPAVRPAATEALTPYLVIRVNGVPIAARGGSWGMDDSRKRVGRERLEPYFRLHREANLNIIRNWLGQNTEEVFYDLADEYGLLVLNDFWVSTQDFQMEPQDPALFLANARDVISHYRNHPSIAVWFGRNEGVPQPILNEGLADLVASLDGTRYYTGSSNTVNLQGSGPYNYRPPEQYFTELARGFSVEVGTPSLSTLEALTASIPAADRWPLSDTHAYHDWHSGGNGDVATFMAALAQQHGAGVSLQDFERKAQLMNYDTYRAIFEGFQAHLWTRNSGRLLWMTHPSWPSNTWQIYSSDYDTGAAYYAVKHACEPLHVQLNLPDFSLAVVNTTRSDAAGLALRSRVLSLDNRLLGERVEELAARANTVTTLAPLQPLTSALAVEKVVLVRLALTDRDGRLVSQNTYWQAAAAADLRRLGQLEPQALALTARRRTAGSDEIVAVRLENGGRTAALNVKMTLLDESGERVLPTYYGDNYVTLLAGEVREIEVRCPSASGRCARVGLRGWNVIPQEVRIAD